MPSAVIELTFDPSIDVVGRAILIETLIVAGAILLGLLAAAILVRLLGADDLGRRPRSDDLLFIALGVVPGAVLGSRLGYVLLHLDYYRAHTAAIVDPTQGGLELTLGVLVGLATGAYVGRLIDAPLGSWANAIALPLLATIALGKVGQAFDGAGQGVPSDVSWATAYAGPGPWGSLAPAVPSHPAQLYEAAGAAGVAVLCLLVVALGGLRRADGRLLLVAIEGWLIIRFGVAFTWRDPLVAGPFDAEQLLIAFAAVLLLVGWLAFARRAARRSRSSLAPAWPDPDTSRRWRETTRVE